MSDQPEQEDHDSLESTLSASTTSSRVGDSTARLPKIVPFRELCRCGDEVWIENEGQLYRLRRTRQGKLILTK